MDTNSIKDEPEASWSETTTPASDDIEGLGQVELQSRLVKARSSKDWGTQPRLFRPTSRRIRPQKDFIKVGVTTGQQSFPRQQSFTFSAILDPRRSMEGSEGSPSSSITIVTSAGSSCTDPWSSSSGFVEEEEDEDTEDDACSWDRRCSITQDGARDQHNVMKDQEHHHDEEMIVPKLEPVEEDVNMIGVEESSIPASENSPIVPMKRPRGRPRKHPKIAPEDKLKIAKNRSKTGCITCRKRKKKCDERKPGCLNCEKNTVHCEGYQPKTLWKSGKERALEEARSRGASSPLPNITLSPIIAGVETPCDRLFFEHYSFRLSFLFTAEEGESNAFRDILLPMAMDHSGLMHSILDLASRHIDFKSSYGKSLLQKYPEVDVDMLEERSKHHNEEARSHMFRDIEIQCLENRSSAATLAQMLCLTLQTLSDPAPKGLHRFHLSKYQELRMTSQPPKETTALQFFDELMKYHIYADQLICLPNSDFSLGFKTEEWELPSTIIQTDAVRLLGVSDGLFLYMSQITNLRNKIRERTIAREEPVLHYDIIWAAHNIDVGIKNWTPAWPAGDKRDLAGMLYRQMIWVYLFRTIYPPKAPEWKIDERLTKSVDEGIDLISRFGPRDSSQTLILAPAFVLGCASFQNSQREKIRTAIGVVKAYMEYKNSDAALEVLEEVWRLMDAKDERSWDWQTIAHTMGMDFLAT